MICWLEQWNENPHGMPTAELRGKSATELVGFADELMAIMAPAGVMTVQEPPDPPFPFPVLASGRDSVQEHTRVHASLNRSAAACSGPMLLLLALANIMAHQFRRPVVRQSRGLLARA
jgi:hypothetical protein